LAQAIVVRSHGGPEVLRMEDVDVGEPAAGQVRIRHEAIGLNFLDVYYRTGLYSLPDGFPFTPGSEGAGTVVAAGEGVEHVRLGDRVAYTVPLGAYATERLIAADRVIRLPDTIDSRTAAAMMLKGLTAQYLLRRTFPVQPGQTVLFHAAAGGVGLIACQWANRLGATVIGTVGSEEKAEVARAHGCHHTINYRREDFAKRVLEITDGAKCDVIYDSVGADAFPASLDCLKPRGMWVLFGQSSGPIKNFDMGMLAQKGSLYATRPTIYTYIARRSDLEAMVGELIDVVASGDVKIEVNQEFALADAAEAHRALEARRTTGATVLMP
jgi:NADPH2:quinone reductase